MGHSGPPLALLGEEEVVVVDVDPGNSCDSRQSSRGQSGDSRGQALPRTNKVVLEVEQGTGGWVGGLLEDKRLAHVGEDGEELELDDGVGVGELRGEADVGVCVELACGAENGGSCYHEKGVTLEHHDGDGICDRYSKFDVSSSS